MTEVDQSPTATVESADHMGGLLAAMIASWEMNGGEAKAEVDIVMPFLKGACMSAGVRVFSRAVPACEHQLSNLVGPGLIKNFNLLLSGESTRVRHSAIWARTHGKICDRLGDQVQTLVELAWFPVLSTELQASFPQVALLSMSC